MIKDFIIKGWVLREVVQIGLEFQPLVFVTEPVRMYVLYIMILFVYFFFFYNNNFQRDSKKKKGKKEVGYEERRIKNKIVKKNVLLILF